MTVDDDNGQPPKSEAVGNCWREFAKTLEAETAGEEGSALLQLSQVSFYFGVASALELVEGILGGAASDEAVRLALDGLREEAEEFLEHAAGLTH